MSNKHTVHLTEAQIMELISAIGEWEVALEELGWMQRLAVLRRAERALVTPLQATPRSQRRSPAQA